MPASPQEGPGSVGPGQTIRAGDGLVLSPQVTFIAEQLKVVVFRNLAEEGFCDIDIRVEENLHEE